MSELSSFWPASSPPALASGPELPSKLDWCELHAEANVNAKASVRRIFRLMHHLEARASYDAARTHGMGVACDPRSSPSTSSEPSSTGTADSGRRFVAPPGGR